MSIPQDLRDDLTAMYGYVPGDLASIAAAIIRGVEAECGVRMQLRPIASRAHSERVPDASGNEPANSIWKACAEGCEVVLLYDGFSIQAFSENLVTGDKDAMLLADNHLSLVHFLVDHIPRPAPAF